MKKILSMVFVLMLVSSVWSTQASAASYDRAKTAKTVKVYVKAGTSYKVAYTVLKGKAKKYAKSYADNDPYRFVKSKKYGKDGYYSIQHKWNGTWYTIGRVNCKTGWMHG